MSKLAHSNQRTMDEIEAQAAIEEGIDMDDEANAFAFELLMPEQFMRAELAKMKPFDIDDDGPIKKLALKFRVTHNVMVLRLAQLSKRLHSSGKRPE
jgi:Zn-dependent peptidase ImmA (M78 family)